MPSDRVFSGLSENHKIIGTRPTELKLWLLEHNSQHTCSIAADDRVQKLLLIL